MAAVVTVVVLVLAAAVAARWLPRGRVGVVSQVDAFESARAVTNRWSSDPSTTPAPLRDYLRQQGARPVEEPEERHPEG